jgi:hypothetical protein
MRVITSSISADGTVTNTPEPWTTNSLKAAIAEYRYRQETAGITVSGIPISTERGDHRIVMAQIRAEARANAGFSVDLKTADGFVSLDAVQVLSVTDAMLWYVTACFAREAALLNALDTGTSIAEVAASMETGWPERVF